MPTLVTTLQGRFGNQCMQFLFAYAFALRRGMKFECEPWLGERVFDLPPYDHPARRDFPRVNELSIFAHEGDCEFRGYAMRQECMLYTKRDAQQWLKIKNEHAVGLKLNVDYNDVIGHRRVGDFIGYGYPVVSQQSYDHACWWYGMDHRRLVMLTEENPTWHSDFVGDLSFLPDFYRMMSAHAILRGNSTFSWVAALLGHGIVLAPIIDGLEGGKEHSVVFAVGNHPRLSNHDFVTDLYVEP